MAVISNRYMPVHENSRVHVTLHRKKGHHYSNCEIINMTDSASSEATVVENIIAPIELKNVAVSR